MPLSQIKKTESKSIEDLIAQLDAPTNLDADNEQQPQPQTNERKVVRGKRTTSTSSNHGASSNNSGNGPSSTTEYYDPVLQKNIIISKKY